MKTIPLVEFLGRTLYITVLRRDRVTNAHTLLRIYEESYVATVRSVRSEKYHFMDGALVEGIGTSELNAFLALLDAINRRVTIFGEVITPVTPDRLNRQAGSQIYWDFVEAADMLQLLRA